MNRHQLLACASAEMQTALKTYTHDDLPRTVTDTAAIDVLSALREGLRIDVLHRLDSLGPGCIIRASNGINYQKVDDAQWNWYTPGSDKPFPHHLRSTLLDAHLIWHPA